MDSIVEENGNSSNVDEGGHNLTTTQQQQTITHSLPPPPPPSGGSTVTSVQPTASAASVLTTASNVHYITQPAHALQSVIQANQSSVIQTAAPTNAHTIAMPKGSTPATTVLYMGKQNTVIQTTSGNTVHFNSQFPCKIKNEPNTHQSVDTNSEDSISEEDSPRGVKEIKRTPSYNKIFNEISGPDISAGTTLQMTESGGIPTIACAGGPSAGGTLMHQDSNAPQYYFPNRTAFNPNNSGMAEDQTRKREIRLQKNREAARECRRKKKEYIKCLENRVAVLENQNKALIEELKSLKELYCQTKND